MRMNTNAGGHEALAVVLPDVAGALRHSVCEIGGSSQRRNLTLCGRPETSWLSGRRAIQHSSEG